MEHTKTYTKEFGLTDKYKFSVDIDLEKVEEKNFKYTIEGNVEECKQYKLERNGNTYLYYTPFVTNHFNDIRGAKYTRAMPTNAGELLYYLDHIWERNMKNGFQDWALNDDFQVAKGDHREFWNHTFPDEIDTIDRRKKPYKKRPTKWYLCVGYEKITKINELKQPRIVVNHYGPFGIYYKAPILQYENK